MAPLKCCEVGGQRAYFCLEVWECFLEEMAFGKALKGWVGNNHRNLGWWFWSKNHVNKSREVGRPGLNDSFWVELRVSK